LAGPLRKGVKKKTLKGVGVPEFLIGSGKNMAEDVRPRNVTPCGKKGLRKGGGGRKQRE